MVSVERPHTVAARLSDDELVVFEALCKKHLRTKSDMLRIIIGQAAARERVKDLIKQGQREPR